MSKHLDTHSDKQSDTKAQGSGQIASLAKPQALAEQSEILRVAKVSLEDISDLTVEPGSQAVSEKMAELDWRNAQSILRFGAGAQSDLQAISQKMLEGVRSKDVGPAGDTLRNMVLSLKGFSVTELDPNRKTSWWEKLVGKTRPIAKFMSRYETVREQIDRIAYELLRHETTLLKDIKSLDKLYEQTLLFYRELGLYIQAGEKELQHIDQQVLPQLEAAGHADELLKAQEIRDLQSLRDDLERRVHDLKLTRQVTMQSLPSIRLVQENDKTLVTRINSTLVNTVPLWETQLAQAVTIFRSHEAAGSITAANDLTNDLLTRNAEQLRQANREVREQNERGVFDIKAIQAANANLIATIEESLTIAEEGKRKRAEAEVEMQTMEAELKQALSKAATSQ
jgi:uncharacterized protein YaaN involved in tellurite resistance